MRDVTRWVVIGGFVVAGLIVVASAIGRGSVDSGHAQFHVAIALVMLASAAVLHRVRPAFGTGSRALILGLIAFGAAQLVEAVGGLGFGPDGYGRVNDLAEIHDLGLAVAPIGLVLFGLGIVVAGTLAFAGFASRWIPRPLATVIGLGVGLPLVGLPILMLTGLGLGAIGLGGP